MCGGGRHLRDDIESASQYRARRVGGVRKIDNLYANGGELPLEPLALFGATPVITFEESSEADLPLGFEFVWDSFDHSFVNIADALNDL